MTTLPSTVFYRQRGFSLLEALVAFLILSVGMLGIASMQTVSLRAGASATLRSAAVQENQEILERMRANPAGLNNGSTSKYAGTFQTTLSAPTNMCSDSGGSVTTCTNPDDMALYDVYEWMQDIKSMFPPGTKATITVADSLPQRPHDVTVTITWPERTPSSSTAATTVSYTTDQLICDANCYPSP